MTKNIENIHHQSAKKLLNSFSFFSPASDGFSIKNAQASDISSSEFEEDGYLFTKYIDELYRGLTKLNYAKWKQDTLQKNAMLRAFAHQEEVFSNERERIINLLCSERLSLMSHSNNIEKTIISPYSDISSEYYSNDSLIALENSIDNSAVTNIVIMGNQMLPAAINAFLSSSRQENSITCAIACDENNFEAEKQLIEKFLILPTSHDKITTGREYHEEVENTVLYLKKWTRRKKRERLY